MQRVDRPRIAVVGAGYWGPRLVRNLHRAAPDVLAAVCDLDPSKLEALAEDYPNLRTTTSVQSLLEDPAIDAFMLALPPHLHHDIGLAALKAGKHLFVEKPIATDVSRGRDLLNAARRVDRQLMVGLVYCHHPLVERARGLLAAGRLGRPTRVISWRTNLNPRPKHANILWLLAPHDLSIFSRWLGTRPNVVSTAMRRERHPDFEDVADVELVYPENVRATVRLSWLEPDKVRRILVAGDVASLVFDEMHAPPRITLHARGWKDGDPEPAPEPDAWSEYLGEPSELLSLMEPVEPLFLECRHFIECLKTGERPLTGGELALEVTEIIQSIQNAGRDEQRAAAENV
ncbi:MAG: Gfo/Idh/MocA family oxidoreductase [Deltaproteobacteria bacterium]|nr:Gfo/Idh/MocA family oxidoreductase [Deltaproteobacteria bacterium]